MRKSLIFIPLLTLAAVCFTFFLRQSQPTEVENIAKPRVVFFSWSRVDPLRGIASMRLDGSQLELIRTVDKNSIAFDPAISPDGKRIAFALLKKDGAKTDIFVENIDGSERIKLTNNTSNKISSFPRWFPDGNSIVYSTSELDESMTKLKKPKIFSVDLKSKEPIYLSNGAKPILSPNGKKILFYDIKLGLSLMSYDGSQRKSIVEDKKNPKVFVPGDWSPDGTRIIYTVNSIENKGIYISRMDDFTLESPMIVHSLKKGESAFGIHWLTSNDVVFCHTSTETLGIISNPEIYTLKVMSKEFDRISPQDRFDVTSDGITTTFLIQSQIALSRR